MRVTALISRSGRAVVHDGETYYVLTADDPAPREADGTHWMHLRGLQPDAEIVPAGEHPYPDVQKRMLEAWRQQGSLDLLIMTMDRDDDGDARRETCEVLEKLFDEQPSLFDWLRAFVLGVKTPEQADLAGGIAAAAAAGAERVQRILTDVRDGGEAIAAEAMRIAARLGATGQEGGRSGGARSPDAAGEAARRGVRG